MCVFMCMCVLIGVFICVCDLSFCFSMSRPYVQYHIQNLAFLPRPVPCADETRRNRFDQQNSSDTPISNNHGGKRNNTWQILRIRVNVRNSLTKLHCSATERKSLTVKIQSDSYSFDIAESECDNQIAL